MRGMRQGSYGGKLQPTIDAPLKVLDRGRGVGPLVRGAGRNLPPVFPATLPRGSLRLPERVRADVNLNRRDR